jgi:hypothetical protein
MLSSSMMDFTRMRFFSYTELNCTFYDLVKPERKMNYALGHLQRGRANRTPFVSYLVRLRDLADVRGEAGVRLAISWAPNLVDKKKT